MLRRLLVCAAMTLGACTTTEPHAAIAPAQPPDAPLIGNWHQLESDCQSPINELIFKRDHTFHVTWTPFETYEDYWGTWRYDAISHQIELTVDNGNYVPPDLVRDGSATVSGNTMSFDGVSFGTPQNGAACAAPFHLRAPIP
jgi:hypothetical protein